MKNNNEKTEIVKIKKSEKPAPVCVLVTSYNYGQYIEEALNSVYNQSLENLDLVIIDDCSTDTSVKILSQWFDKNKDRFNSFIVLRNKINQEVIISRNIALEYVHSEFIFVLDADNKIYKTCILKLLKAFEHSRADFAYPFIARFGLENTIVNTLPWSDKRLRSGPYIDGMALFRRSVIEHVGRYTESGEGWEDYDLFVKISKIGGKGIQVPEILACYRTHHASKTNVVARNNVEVIFSDIKSRHLDFFNFHETTKVTDNKNQRFVSHILPSYTQVVWAVGNPLKFIKKYTRIYTQRYFRKKTNQEYIQEVFDIKFSDSKKISFERHPNPKVSIVIPVFNKWQFTYNCLRTLKENTSGVEFEIIVVDNGSTDSTEFLFKNMENVLYLRNNENLGFARACNIGAKHAKGEYILFLNNDTVPLHGWLSNLVKELDNNPQTGIVGSKLLYPDNTVQHAGIFFYGGDNTNKSYPYHVYRGAKARDKEVNKRKQFPAVTGACLFIRKNLFEKVSGFDERYLNGFEDIDLCFQVSELGYTVMYNPQSCLYHYESMTEGRFNDDTNNSVLFFEKWKNKDIIKNNIEKEDKKYIKDYQLFEQKAQPKITIITPTFNAESSIEECIVSVAKQSYGKKEHLIIDGLSTDRTTKIIKEYAKKYKHIKLISEKDHGIYDAMNKGIKLASGDWIYFLGSDDSIYNDRVLSNIAENMSGDLGVLYGNVIWKGNGYVYDGLFNPIKLIEKNICHQAIFVKKEVFALLGNFDTKYNSLADWAFNMKWFNNKSIKHKYINTIVAEFSMNGFSSINYDQNFFRDKEKLVETYLKT